MQLTSLGRAGSLQKLIQTPFDFHGWLLQNISREEENARLGKKGRIIAKMNALIEPEIIRALYRASQAGVQIDLIVRGICCLRPGIPGVSENIRVRSVLGRFLEHHRVVYFHADGEDEVWCSSADWMPRNFFRRVEICFPVLRRKLRDRVIDECMLEHLGDNASAWDMRQDGSYVPAHPAADGERKDVQERLLERLSGSGA